MATKNGVDNLVYLFILIFPTKSAHQIYTEWKENKILKEYPRPSKKNIKTWVLDTYQELKQKGIYFKSIQ